MLVNTLPLLCLAFYFFAMMFILLYFPRGGPTHSWLGFNEKAHLPYCSPFPKGLIGSLTVRRNVPSMKWIEDRFPDQQLGGHWKPKDCLARQRVAIIIPYRERKAHLQMLLPNLIPVLRRQKIEYRIFLVEPKSGDTFNRGKLMNIGYIEAQQYQHWDCFIFHDVDLITLDDRNLYSCSSQPKHMSASINKFNFSLPYPTYFGGAVALKGEHMDRMNGWSNDYWGWGGEDDDLARRVGLAKMRIDRPPSPMARYEMLKHGRENKSNPINPCRKTLLRNVAKSWKSVGLNNLKYSVIQVKPTKLYTSLIVDLLEDASRKRLARQGFPGC